MKYYALIETDNTKWDYNCTYIREWEGDADSLREHMKNMGTDECCMDTVEIRPATDEEIEWYNSDAYIE